MPVASRALVLRVFIQLRRKSSHSALLRFVHALGSESVSEIGSHLRNRQISKGVPGSKHTRVIRLGDTS